MTNQLYYGDNLTVLRDHIATESVDLIYLDPPFNSNASYNVLFKGPSGGESPAQIEAFDDTWHWTEEGSGRALIEIKQSQYQEAAAMLDAMVGFLGKNAMTAYLCMMGVRLTELHRVLKPTGSLYLHCDPTASHYLKILLDAVFGATRFGAEIIWKRTSAHSDAGQGRRLLGYQHDTIFQYMKSSEYIWNTQYQAYDESYIENTYRYVEASSGRRYGSFDITAPGGSDPKKRNPHYEFLGVTRYWRFSKERMQSMYEDGYIFQTKPGAVPRQRRFLDDMPGTPLQDLWLDIPPLQGQAKERLGYPTQKPVALLERILAASSNPGDVVLDPFCGCGTTVHAAQKMGRNWIGIDVTPVAISLIRTRLFDAFQGDAKFDVIGLPRDVDGARMMFEEDDKTKKKFEMWACGLIDSYPQQSGKKGADGGIDGIFWFGAKKQHKAIVQVKGGAVGVPAMRELDAVVKKQNAQIGVLMCLQDPTKPMRDWADQSDAFDVDGFGTVPRLQIVTIEQALSRGPDAVQTRIRHADTYKAAPKEKRDAGQGRFDL